MALTLQTRRWESATEEEREKKNMRKEWDTETDVEREKKNVRK